jgi:hypothetical protein
VLLVVLYPDVVLQGLLKWQAIVLVASSTPRYRWMNV